MSEQVWRVAAFDPGMKPAAAVYCGPKFRPSLFPKLGVGLTVNKKQTFTPDVPSILYVIDQTEGNDLCTVEDVWTRPVRPIKVKGKNGEDKMVAQGGASQGKLMEAKGLLRGLIQGRGRRLKLILPTEWYAAWKLKAEDDVSRQKVLRLFPYLAPDFKHANSHDLADALLMAVYVWHKEQGLPLPQ